MKSRFPLKTHRRKPEPCGWITTNTDDALKFHKDSKQNKFQDENQSQDDIIYSRDGTQVGPSFFIVNSNSNGKLKLKRKWSEKSYPPAATGAETSYEDSKYIKFCRMSIASRWIEANVLKKKGCSTPSHVIADAYAEDNPTEPLKFNNVSYSIFYCLKLRIKLYSHHYILIIIFSSLYSHHSLIFHIYC